MSHQRLIHIANLTMALAVILCSLALSAVFLFDQYLSIPQQIMGHTSLLISATALKIGYVIRLTGLRRQQLLAV